MALSVASSAGGLCILLLALVDVLVDMKNHSHHRHHSFGHCSPPVPKPPPPAPAVAQTLGRICKRHLNRNLYSMVGAAPASTFAFTIWLLIAYFCTRCASFHVPPNKRSPICKLCLPCLRFYEFNKKKTREYDVVHHFVLCIEPWSVLVCTGLMMA